MELPKTQEVPSKIDGTQNKIVGLQLAGGRVAWEQFSPNSKDAGYIFKKNHGFQLAVDPDQLKSLGVTMDTLLDCIVQLDQMGAPEKIKGSIALRTNPGYLPNGLVITSTLDPRVRMSVMFHDPDYEDTDFLVAWFIDDDHFREMETDAVTYKPQREVDVDELGPAQANKERERAGVDKPAAKSGLSNESVQLKEYDTHTDKSFNVYDKHSNKKKPLHTFKAPDAKTAIQKARKMFWLPSSSFEAEEVHGDQAATAESVLGISEEVRFESLVDKLRSDKPEYLKEDLEFVSIYLKPGLDEDKLAEELEEELGINIKVGKNQLHLYTADRDDVKAAVKMIGERNISKLPLFPDLIPSGMTPLFPKKKEQQESKEMKGTLIMEGNKKEQVKEENKVPDASLSFESVDFWGLPKSLAETDATYVGQNLAKPTGKEGTEYGQKPLSGKPEYSKSVKEYDTEEQKLQATMKSNETGMKHVMPGNELAKPSSKVGTEYGQSDLNQKKNLKVGADPSKGNGEHEEGTGAADSDGKQFTDLAANKVKVGKPGSDHGDHVEEAKKVNNKKLTLKERMKMKADLKKKRMKAEGVEHETMGMNKEDDEFGTSTMDRQQVPNRMDHLKKRYEHAKKQYEAACKQKEAVGSPVTGRKEGHGEPTQGSEKVESKYSHKSSQYEWQKKKLTKPAIN
jgi:hypothetical protein